MSRGVFYNCQMQKSDSMRIESESTKILKVTVQNEHESGYVHLDKSQVLDLIKDLTTMSEMMEF